MNNVESLVTRAAAMAAMAVTGVSVGAGMGIVGGPVGGIAGTFPGALFGGVTGWLLADQFRRCPHCGRIFKTYRHRATYSVVLYGLGAVSIIRRSSDDRGISTLTRSLGTGAHHCVGR